MLVIYPQRGLGDWDLERVAKWDYEKHNQSEKGGDMLRKEWVCELHSPSLTHRPLPIGWVIQGSCCVELGFRLVTKGSEIHFRESAFSRPLVILTYTHEPPDHPGCISQLYQVYPSLSSAKLCACRTSSVYLILDPMSFSPSVSVSLECFHSNPAESWRSSPLVTGAPAAPRRGHFILQICSELAV